MSKADFHLLNSKQAEFVRRAHKIMEAHALGAEMDAGFDAGEWSGPAHDEAERAQLEVLADEYGFTGEEFETLVYPTFCEECGDSGCPACICETKSGGITQHGSKVKDGKLILDWNAKMGNIYQVEDYFDGSKMVFAMAADGVEVDMFTRHATLCQYLVDHPAPKDW